MSLLSPNLPLLILLGYLATAFSEFSSECAPPSRVDRFPNSRIDEIYAPFDTLRTDLEDYLWPTNASTVLTSSFADYRRTHFHEGIDISTNNQKGYPVYASRGGYVSRIHVSRRGYGKMLYLRHHDGFVTMYAHLQRFKDSIEVYVKKMQKTNRAYSLEIDLDSAMFRVAKGEVIAYSGDTGIGSAHLHFELRDSSMNAINPFLSPQFSSLLHDKVPPLFHMVAFTPLDRSSRVHGKSRVWIVNAKRGRRGEFHVDGRVSLKGKIGISVRVTDQSDMLKYRTGPHRFEMYLDGEQILTSAKNFIPENEAHQVAAYYDRSSLLRRMGRFEKLYIESGNRLPFYHRLPEGSGLIDTSTLEPGSHELTIHTWDLAGNRSVIGVILLTGVPVRQ